VAESGEGVAFVAGGAAAGAGISVTVGGMGLAGGFGAVGIGTVPVVGAGAVVGAAAYGAVKAIGDGDTTALGAVAFGAAAGAGVSTFVGSMGLVAPKIGIGVAVGMASVATAGAVVGLAAYGIAKLLDEGGTGETAAQVFDRMEEKGLWQDAYTQALLELELAEEVWMQKFPALEIEDDLKALKAELRAKTDLKLKLAPSISSNQTLKPSITSETSAHQLPPYKGQSAAAEIETEVVSLKAQPSPTWRCVHTLKGHSASVNSIAISADGQTIASGSDDRTVRLWNLITGKWFYTFFGQPEAVLSVALSPDSQIIASGCVDQKITSWKLDKKVFLRTFFDHSGFPYSHSGFVYSVAFSPDGKTLASGSADKTIRLWGRYTGKLIRTLNGHSDTVSSVAISPDGQTLASGSADKTIRLWPLSGGQQHRILTGHSGWVNSVAISPDAHTLVSGSTDSTIKLWNLQTGELLRDAK